jgi:predicted DNA-binding transcriptional regulator AlpA
MPTKQKSARSAASAARPSPQSASASRLPAKDPPPPRRPLPGPHYARVTARAEAALSPLDKVLLSYADLRTLGIPYHRGHLWRLMRQGKFPQAVALGPEVYARKVWRAADIAAYLAALPYSGGGNEAA